MLPGIGVFGTGEVVKVIIPFLREKGFKIEAIWGPTISEADKMASLLDIPFHTSRIDDVLLRKDVDLIFIMCSPNLHAQIAVKALGIGKHVVCDKPAGLTQSDALKMVKASQYYPSLISIINHSLRFLPAFINLKREISDGYLGGPISFIDVRVQMGSLLPNVYNWLADEAMGGGVISLIGSHVIDLISYITNQKALRVHAVIRTFTETTKHINGIRRVTAPDFCCFQMELDDGILATVSLSSHFEGQLAQEVLVWGPGGHIVVRGNNLYGYKNNQEETLHLDAESIEESLITCNFIPKPYVNGLRKMTCALKQAFQLVEDKKGWLKEPVLQAANFEDGLYVQAVIEALNRSSRQKEWTKVSMITEELDSNPMPSAASVRATAISIS